MKRTAAVIATLVAAFALSACAPSESGGDSGEYIPPEIGQSESTVSLSTEDSSVTVIGRLTGTTGTTYLYEIVESYGELVEGATLVYEVVVPGAKYPGEGCDPALMGTIEVGETFVIDCAAG